MLKYKKIRDKNMALKSSSNIKFFGVVDILVGSKDLYKARKAYDENNLTGEDVDARTFYNIAKIGLGATRLFSLGYLAGGHFFSTAAAPQGWTDIALTATFCATYAVEGFLRMYPTLLESEALNTKHFQSKILSDNEILNRVSRETELPVESSYQLFMFGNRLGTGNFVDKGLNSLKNKINDIQANWSERDFKVLNKVEKFLYKLINKSEKLALYMENNTLKAQLKKKGNEIITKHTDYKSEENKNFMSYIAKKFPDKIRDEETIIPELRRMNEKAILTAYNTIRKQNVELFFARIVLDYNNGIKHDDLINKFSTLHSRTQLAALKDTDQVLIESYKNISAMAFKMQKNEELYPIGTGLYTILNGINSDIIRNNKLKIYSFNDVFSFAKNKEIEKSKNIGIVDDNIYNDSLIPNTEIRISASAFKSIIKIKESVIEKTKKIDNKKMQEKNKKKI